MTTGPLDAPPILTLYLQLSQYPVLAHQIRERMRAELFRRGVITSQHFEQEAKEKAILSQHREGLADPYGEEDTPIWEQRLQQVRDHLTDFYFAYNLPTELFQRIVSELVAERRQRHGALPSLPDLRLTFNPELAPLELLLRQARQYESLPPEEQASVRHHLEEIVVVLIRTMVSDQLGFVRVAKAWFSAADFEFIQARRIGGGKIGGKAAGMLLAWKILCGAAPELAEQITLPRSYFIGADVFYDYKAINHLAHNQKYKPAEQIRAEYPGIQATFEQGSFPAEIAQRLRDLLEEIGPTPIIVRSSSLLEDNFGTSFAGKYASFFCPNQGSPAANLRDLELAIQRIYASVYSPDAIIYRRRMGLLDYDERMAVLIQEVQGQAHGRHFFPTLAGVALSQSPLVWTSRLRREEGFVRLVLGLGTRAVERVGEDFPRLIFLSHPLLRPEHTPVAMTHYSQHWVDVIDLEQNTFTSVPAARLLGRDFEPLRWVASRRDEAADTLLPLSRLAPDLRPEQLVLTFDNLLRRSGFVSLLKEALAQLAHHYGKPVDVEFALTLRETDSGRPSLLLHLLQCRPQAVPGAAGPHPDVPADVPPADCLFATTRMVPHGHVKDVEYIVYVAPQGYHRLADAAQRKELAALIGRLNKALEGHDFILLGPGRWGSSNLQLGVPVSYADIYNARALVELPLETGESAPEPSYGTHFFQDLVEAQIYALAVYVGEGADRLNADFLRGARNALPDLLPEAAPGPECLKLIHVPAERDGQRLQIIMDGARALAFFASGG